jgi:hypothetical protein
MGIPFVVHVTVPIVELYDGIVPDVGHEIAQKPAVAYAAFFQAGITKISPDHNRLPAEYFTFPPPFTVN